MPKIQVTSAYRFTPLNHDTLPSLKFSMESFAELNPLRGMVLIGAEGINLTVSGEAPVLTNFKALVSSALGLSDLQFKDAFASKHPFNFFKVKIKEEIVTLGRPGLAPRSPVNSHLTPEQWQTAMKDPEAIVLDTRNDYEVEIGKFKSAIDFGLKEFREFPEAVKQAGLPKDKKILMYCTGGIRCEKAILEMNAQGYKNVHQLGGGILNYLAEFPEHEFEGECFVFDYRVAVDQKLEPTKNYKLCPHCGQPARQSLNCAQCGSPSVICVHCEQKGVHACSKNCAHHLKLAGAKLFSHKPTVGLKANSPE